MTTPQAPCQRCGRIRFVRGQANPMCVDCARYTEALPNEALPPGEWVRNGLVFKFVPDTDPDIPVQVCGTDAGYHRHLRARQPTCNECRRAHANAAAATRPPRGPLQPHGTRAAFQRHKKANEIACTECREAETAYHQRRRQQQKEAA